MKKICIVLILCFLVPVAQAAVVTLTAGDGYGTSSFNSGLNWSDGLAPSAGNDYEVSIEQLRTPPDNGSYTFGGDSLKINTGGILMYKGSDSAGVGTITVNNLIGNGGHIIDHRSGTSDICTLDGNISVAANSVMYAKQGPVHVYSTITGSSNITNPGSDGTGRTLWFHGDTSGYTGSIVNDGRFVVADDGEFNFLIGASGVNNDITGTGIASYKGDFVFDLTSAGTGLGDSWTIANVATQDFDTTFNVVGFTDIGGGLWRKHISGELYYQFSEGASPATLTVVPEPATITLLGLGALMLRRKRD